LGLGYLVEGGAHALGGAVQQPGQVGGLGGCGGPGGLLRVHALKGTRAVCMFLDRIFSVRMNSRG
jgi:hypothetical protein